MPICRLYSLFIAFPGNFGQTHSACMATLISAQTTSCKSSYDFPELKFSSFSLAVSTSYLEMFTHWVLQFPFNFWDDFSLKRKRFWETCVSRQLRLHHSFQLGSELQNTNRSRWPMIFIASDVTISSCSSTYARIQLGILARPNRNARYPIHIILHHRYLIDFTPVYTHMMCRLRQRCLLQFAGYAP